MSVAQATVLGMEQRPPHPGPEAEGKHGSGYESLRTFLDDQFLPQPPLLDTFAPRIRQCSELSWGTEFLSPMDLYLFDVRYALGEIRAAPQVFHLSVAGHGMNSWGLNLLVRLGPVAVFTQHAWGGIYQSRARARESVATTFELVTQSVSRVTHPMAPLRYVACYSEFRGHCRIVDATIFTSGEGLEDCSIVIPPRERRAFPSRQESLFAMLDNLPLTEPIL